MNTTFNAQHQIDELLTRSFEQRKWQQPKRLEALLADKIRASIPLTARELHFFEIEEMTLDIAA